MKTRVRSQRKFSRRSQVSDPSLDPKIFLQEDAQAAEKLIHADNVNKSQLKSLKTQNKVNNKEKTHQFKKRFGHFSRLVELKTPIPIHPNNTFEINEDGEESIEISIRQEKLKKASLRVLARGKFLRPLNKISKSLNKDTSIELCNTAFSRPNEPKIPKNSEPQKPLASLKSLLSDKFKDPSMHSELERDNSFDHFMEKEECLTPFAFHREMFPECFNVPHPNLQWMIPHSDHGDEDFQLEAPSDSGSEVYFSPEHSFFNKDF